MAGLTTLLGVGASLISQKMAAKKQKKSQDQARRDAELDANKRDVQARKSEVFGETEGKGQGMVGEVRSGLSEELDDDEELARSGKGARSTLQI